MSTKDKIIKQALKSLINNDYEKVSLVAIAGELGLTKGSIYHYFNSKDELLKEIILQMLGMMFEKIKSMDVEKDGIKTILENLLCFKDFYNQLIPIYKIDNREMQENMIYMIIMAIRKYPELKKTIGDIYREMREIISESLEKAYVLKQISRKIDYDLLAFEISSFIEGSLFILIFDDSINITERGSKYFKKVWSQLK